MSASKRSVGLHQAARKARAHRAKFKALKQDILTSLKSLERYLVSTRERLATKATELDVVLNRFLEFAEDGPTMGMTIKDALSEELEDSIEIITSLKGDIEEVTK